MPIVLPDLSGLAEGISTAGGALAGALENRAQRRLQQRREGALESALAGSDLQTQSGQQDFLQKTVQAGIPTQDALGILDRAIKMQSASQSGFQYGEPEQLGDLFQRLGVQPEVAQDYAELYQGLSKGGQTSFANMFIDKLQRGEFGRKPGVSMEDMQAQAQSPLSDVEPQEEGFVFEEVDPFSGMTPKEKVKHQQFLMKENNPIIQENSKKVKSLKDESRMISQMQRLNDSKKLPSGMGRLNVDIKEGKLHLPAGANPETQLYVKMINDWTTKAKESYGSRVTNFDLQQFMARLPTLANSEEGRRIIQSQMSVINDINKLHHETVQSVYDRYGASGITPDEADRIARDMKGEREAELEQKYVDSLDAQTVYDMKQRMGPDLVLVEKDGIFKTVSPNNQEKALQLGWRIR